jgi:hypothetical protein
MAAVAERVVHAAGWIGSIFVCVRVELCISRLVSSPMQTRVDSSFTFIKDRVLVSQSYHPPP